MPDFIVKFDEPVPLKPGEEIRGSVPSVNGQMPYVSIWNGSAHTLVTGVLIPVNSNAPTDDRGIV